jgi:hypothetical protein
MSCNQIFLLKSSTAVMMAAMLMMMMMMLLLLLPPPLAAADDDDDAAAADADADDDTSPTLASKLQHHNASLTGHHLSAPHLKPQISSHASCNHASHFCHDHLRHTPPTARCIAAICTCPFVIHCNPMRSFGISFHVPSHSRSCFRHALLLLRSSCNPW